MYQMYHSLYNGGFADVYNGGRISRVFVESSAECKNIWVPYISVQTCCFAIVMSYYKLRYRCEQIYISKWPKNKLV